MKLTVVENLARNDVDLLVKYGPGVISDGRDVIVSTNDAEERRRLDAFLSENQRHVGVRLVEIDTDKMRGASYANYMYAR